ncbi:MAG: NlpC/P60 family protein, partial [Spirochaetia bacterium]|nr:NlpC/P60 family protein [Spirochaetia bacterium]
MKIKGLKQNSFKKYIMLYFIFKNKLTLGLFVFGLLFMSCQNPQNNYKYTEIDAPEEIAERAYRFAELYAESETEYDLGGQDPARTAIKIDCSGLIIMCYKYALVDTKYILLQSDMTANYMYKNASTIIPRADLKKGNLLFMGEETSDTVSHIAIFEKEENGIIYFIDSTQKDINGDGINDIFRSLGVDYIIEGGQTMNPSTEDILNAIEKINADNIFIFPNNKNIILAANQA